MNKFGKDYGKCGLRMIDPFCLMYGTMSWVKLFVDDTYDSMWTTIKFSALKQVNDLKDLLWRSSAPKNVINSSGF